MKRLFVRPSAAWWDKTNPTSFEALTFTAAWQLSSIHDFPCFDKLSSVQCGSMRCIRAIPFHFKCDVWSHLFILPTSSTYNKHKNLINKYFKKCGDNWLFAKQCFKQHFNFICFCLSLSRLMEKLAKDLLTSFNRFVGSFKTWKQINIA